ncbi:MAG: succinyldiaminopimelate aminotransferase [Planctomycetota bacterium]|nr:MAG: succinyldiaminopimelate aminotransferase [Planctomycetota bacterium]
MKNLQDLFNLLWEEYSNKNPQVQKIHENLKTRGEEVINDHIALRTFNDKRINVDVLAKAFIDFGYKEINQYKFEEKNLFAKHYEHPENKWPKVFISELILDKFSKQLQDTIITSIDQIELNKIIEWDFSCSQILWIPISKTTYLEVQKESDYAAWLLTNGFCANHFTVNTNDLKTFDSLEDINQHIKSLGLVINSSGGEIKGSSKQLLEQSSTLADQRIYQFSDESATIPCCYYEFAKRYPMQNGKLFQGFIASSADKIFESTDSN